jgi:hypothetical protein
LNFILFWSTNLLFEQKRERQKELVRKYNTTQHDWHLPHNKATETPKLNWTRRLSKLHIQKLPPPLFFNLNPFFSISISILIPISFSSKKQTLTLNLITNSGLSSS